MMIMQMFNDATANSRIKVLLEGKGIELNGISQEQKTGNLHVQASYYGNGYTYREEAIKLIEQEIKTMTGHEVSFNLHKLPERGVVTMRSW